MPQSTTISATTEAAAARVAAALVKLADAAKAATSAGGHPRLLSHVNRLLAHVADQLDEAAVDIETAVALRGRAP